MGPQRQAGCSCGQMGDWHCSSAASGRIGRQGEHSKSEVKQWLPLSFLSLKTPEVQHPRREGSSECGQGTVTVDTATLGGWTTSARRKAHHSIRDSRNVPCLGGGGLEKGSGLALRDISQPLTLGDGWLGSVKEDGKPDSPAHMKRTTTMINTSPVRSCWFLPISFMVTSSARRDELVLGAFPPRPLLQGQGHNKKCLPLLMPRHPT